MLLSSTSHQKPADNPSTLTSYKITEFHREKHRPAEGSAVTSGGTGPIALDFRGVKKLCFAEKPRL